MAVLLLSVTPVAFGAEVQRVDITYERGEYHVQVDAVLSAHPAAVYAVLTDYALWPELSDLIKESEVIEVASASTKLVRMVSEGCVLWFCKRIEQVQWMHAEPQWRIGAEVLPERSDLRSGWARTRLVEHSGRTLFHYEMSLVPDFWVPPVIGPMMIRRKLRQQAIETAETVEAAAAR
ncbi:MAG: hypothetical protein LC632_02075 [Xanthomonadaceae bacterium]|nr:hypothetical protein [Xanthomonadaceae bacterium]